MWIMLAPASTARRASAAYSSGVYGIAGHWSRSATAPEMAQVTITGSSSAMGIDGDEFGYPAWQWIGKRTKGLAHAWNDHRGNHHRHHRRLPRSPAPAGAGSDGLRRHRDRRDHRLARRLLPLHDGPGDRRQR